MMEHHTQPAHRHNARIGMLLFFVYLLMYASFVGVFAYDYKLMAKPVFEGVNLAIVWGMGLIVAAIVLAIVYMLLCQPESAPSLAAGMAAAQLDHGKPLASKTQPSDLPPSESA